MNDEWKDGPESSDTLDEPLTSPSQDTSEALELVNKLFTPVLIRRKIEQSIDQSVKLDLAESGQYTERTTLGFDDSATYAQLVAVCAHILQMRKNTPNWQAFQKAAAEKKAADLNMQNEESIAAPALAKEYLIDLSKSNNSPTARDAATDLLSVIQKE